MGMNGVPVADGVSVAAGEGVITNAVALSLGGRGLAVEEGCGTGEDRTTVGTALGEDAMLASVEAIWAVGVAGC